MSHWSTQRRSLIAPHVSDKRVPFCFMCSLAIHFLIDHYHNDRNAFYKWPYSCPYSFNLSTLLSHWTTRRSATSVHVIRRAQRHQRRCEYHSFLVGRKTSSQRGYENRFICSIILMRMNDSWRRKCPCLGHCGLQMCAESSQREMGSGNGLNLDLRGERARLAFCGDWKRPCDSMSHVNWQTSALTQVYSTPNFANTYL